jgi:hypothetical protein
MDNSLLPTEPAPPIREPPPTATAVDDNFHQSTNSLPAIFYAVRRRQGGLRAIFISEKEEAKWENLLQEIREFVEIETAEFQAFTTLEGAAHYLLNYNSNDNPSGNTTGANPENNRATAAAVVQNDATIPTPPSPASPEQPATKQPPPSDVNPPRKKSPSTPLPGPPAKKTKVSHKKAAAKFELIVEKDSTHFETMLQEFREYQKASNTTAKLKQSPALRDWAQRVRFQFQKLQEGKASTLTPERIQKLNDAGSYKNLFFFFLLPPNVQYYTTHSSSSNNTGFVFCPRSNFRTRTWEERLEQLQEYKVRNVWTVSSVSEIASSFGWDEATGETSS